MQRRSRNSLLVVLVLFIALAVILLLRQKAPPEAARLLPESDAIVYIQLKALRTLSHLDAKPVTRSPDFEKFVEATGIVPERDIDSAAFALHRMPDPRGPNGPVAYSEVFTGNFDGQRLDRYLASITTVREEYAGHTIYSIPSDGRTLRVTIIGYDVVAASNTPTAEQIHSMLDRSRASALSTAGSSLLAARYSEVPLLSQAWAIGHIGLPFAEGGRISLMGLQLPLRDDTNFVASLRYTGSVHLRIEEFAQDDEAARRTVQALNALLSVFRGLSGVQPPRTDADAALRQIVDSAKIQQDKARAVIDASASVDQIKLLAAQTDDTNRTTSKP